MNADDGIRMTAREMSLRTSEGIEYAKPGRLGTTT
jgi:hypothetical protein